MELSLEFLKAKVEQEETVSLVGNGGEQRFCGIRVLGRTTVPEEGMLYACAGDAEQLLSQHARLPEQAGIVVGRGQPTPKGMPALVFPDLEIEAAFNLVNKVFERFAAWQERVYRKALEQPQLHEFMGMLNEVTPNPWYIADGSYRVLAARNAPEVEDLSYIWRFLYRNRRLPLETILAMEDMGKIEQMSRRKTAYIPTVEPFNIPFVSKTVDTSEGAVAHFYIIGVYTRLSAYEVEIAEFFGNVLTQMLAKGTAGPPTLGRFYDSLLSSLIERRPPDSASEILAKMYSDLGWSPADKLRLVVFGSPGAPESVSERQKLLTVESRCRSRSFFHNGHVTAIINVARFGRNAPAGTDAFALLLRMLARELRCNVGVSEQLGGFHDVMNLGKWYDQALFCLETCEAREAGKRVAGGASVSLGPVVVFPSVALRYFQSRIAATGGLDAFVHPALGVLGTYDEKNQTNLTETLRVYLENDRNVTRTASLLFVHRNTLLKRMNKIASLASVDLDDAECRKRLLVSFLVVDSVSVTN